MPPEDTKPLLVVAPWLPKPDRTAGCRRLAHLLRLLRMYGPVDLFTFYGDGNAYFGEYARYRKQLEQDGIRVLEHNSNDLDAALCDNRYRAIWCEFWGTACHYDKRLRYFQPSVPIIVDCVDLEHRRLAANPNPKSAAKVEAVRRGEIEAITGADWVVAVSDEERDIIAQLVPARRGRITTLPIIYAPHRPEQRCSETPGQMLFVGSMHHPPNLDAVRWFVSEVLPRILDKHPAATLRIIGDPPHDEPLFVTPVPPGVEYVGWVPDLMPHLAQAQISIAPLRYGAGMKGKVTESLAVGPAIVTTDVGAQGMAIQSGREALITMPNNAQAFADAVLALLESPGLRTELVSSARAYISRSCSPELVSSRVGEMLTQVDMVTARSMSGLSRPAYGSWYAAVKMRRSLRALFHPRFQTAKFQ